MLLFKKLEGIFLLMPSHGVASPSNGCRSVRTVAIVDCGSVGAELKQSPMALGTMLSVNSYILNLTVSYQHNLVSTGPKRQRFTLFYILVAR